MRLNGSLPLWIAEVVQDERSAAAALMIIVYLSIFFVVFMIGIFVVVLVLGVGSFC